MGRELRRKQAKKEGKSLQKEETKKSSELKKYICTLLAVITFGALIYLLAALFVTKELDWFDKKDTSSEKTKTYIILAKEIFKQKEEDYYVYFYDFNEKTEDSSITNTVTSKLSESTVYKVDTSSALNSNYVGETTNKKAKSLEELKVKSHTLIKVSADTISEYYEEDEITKKLG